MFENVLKGKTAVVTGSNSGIGLGIARAMAAAGANVVINSFTDDALPHETFHYMLCNPPFGVEWKKYEKFVRDENENKGYAGRFGAGGGKQAHWQYPEKNGRPTPHA